MKLLLFVCFVFGSYCVGSENHENKKKNTELSRVLEDRPLLFATLGGGMVAVELLSGTIIWKLKDEPVVKVPNQHDNLMPQFLPDPRHGFLYMYGPRGDQQMLKKLPFTIPELVANAPCRSTEGILYTGKKSDTWFMIDPLTGSREHVSGFDKSKIFNNGNEDNTCTSEKKRGIYIARTEYNILMHDSKNVNQKWNVTFFDYTSHAMGKEMLNDYGIIHFTSTSNGRVMSFDRKTGDLVWSHNFESPVVAAYLLDRDGLITVPFNSMGDDTLDHIMEDASTLRDGQGIKNSNIELYPTLYVGEHNHGLYALSSLVDKNTITISTSHTQPLLIEGPATESQTKFENTKYEPVKNVHYKLNDLNLHVSAPYLLLGHYKVPELTTTPWLPVLPNTNILNMQDSPNSVKLINGQVQRESENDVENETNLKSHSISVSVQTDELFEGFNFRPDIWYKQIYIWLHNQENKALKVALIILMGLVITMFWYLRYQAREFQQLSQGGSRGSNVSTSSNGGEVTGQLVEIAEGEVQIGKIAFFTDLVLGKGCEGTFVYRGTFDKRDVAVKRLLPECFSFADREVALLRESDAHAHVVRYYCTERDKQFRYIALELCSATLQDYVEKKLNFECKIEPVEVLRQATMGLSHLHSMDIVHRDIKPHNVLLSMPTPSGEVRAMISDFGLSKKLNIGRTSFSRRSGVTGTDGWIAPEMINGERTTTSVDIFSLGCVFYYVLSKGHHPFGDVLRRQANILTGDYNLDQLDKILPEEEVVLTKILIRAMISDRVNVRPPCDTVLRYPMFWGKQSILNFLQDVSDFCECGGGGGGGGAGRLEQPGGRGVVRGEWRAHVCGAVAGDLRARRTYRGDRVAHLLRAIRNKKHHYKELDPEVRASLGKLPNGFVTYWLRRFPLLLPHTWIQMQQFRTEDILQDYYSQNFTFSRDDVAELNSDEYEDVPDEMCDPERNELFSKSRVYFDETDDKQKSYRQTSPKKDASPRKDVSPKKSPRLYDWRSEAQDFRLKQDDIRLKQDDVRLKQDDVRLKQDDVRLRDRHYKKKEKKREEMPVWTLPPQ